MAEQGNGLTEEELKELEVFKRLVDIAEGRVSIKSRVAPILDPDNIQTSSVLNPLQVKYCTDTFFLADTYPMFQPLKTHAVHLMYTALSKGGIGVQNAIKLVGAMSEAKAMQKLGVMLSGEKEAKK